VVIAGAENNTENDQKLKEYAVSEIKTSYKPYPTLNLNEKR